MELNKFITDVLKQIQDGVKNAMGEELLHIAHGVVFHKYNPEIPEKESCCIDYISFDVAISEAKGKGGVGVSLASDDKASGTALTKVTFRIPIYWETEACKEARNKFNNSLNQK